MANPTAAMLVIGDEILSGRTHDSNTHHLAGLLTAHGIDLREARVVADDQAAIIAAVRALSAAYTHVFTSGGIGPTHDDITADAIAAAFGATDRHPRRRARDPDGVFRGARHRADAGADAHGADPRRGGADRQPDLRSPRVQLAQRACLRRYPEDLPGDGRLGPRRARWRHATPQPDLSGGEARG